MCSIPCTVCGTAVPGFPDADVTCADCEASNFAGDPLRHPPKQQRREDTPQPWWRRERLPLAPRRDGLRALTCVHGPWVWSPETGVEERGDA